MVARRVFVAIVVIGAIVIIVNTTTKGQRWMQDRMETIRWVTNELRTLHPSFGPH